MLKLRFSPLIWVDLINMSTHNFFAKNNSMSARNKFYIQFWVINNYKKKFKAKKCNHVIAILGYALINAS